MGITNVGGGSRGDPTRGGPHKVFKWPFPVNWGVGPPPKRCVQPGHKITLCGKREKRRGDIVPKG